MTAQTAMTPKETISAALRELSTLIQFTRDRRNKFKSAQYNKAADTIENLEGDLDHDVLLSLTSTSGNGIGAKIGDKIDEIMRTGTCSNLKKMRKRFGHLLNLTQVAGIGPATAKVLYETYGVKDRNGVLKLIDEGKIKDKRIIEGAKRNEEERIPYSVAKDLADRLVDGLHEEARELIEQTIACGSLRRQKETIGDIDIVVVTDAPKIVGMAATKLLDKVSDDGDTRVGGVVDGVHVDFRFCTPENYGAMLIYFTGSKEFNINVRARAKKRGWVLNEYGLFDADETLIAGKTEKEVFDALGLEYVEPRNRIPSFIKEKE